MRTVLVLNLLSALAGIVAAVFWFKSAAGELPPYLAYWDAPPPTDPFLQALQAGARENRIAAALTGLSVLLAAVGQVFSAVTSGPR